MSDQHDLTSLQHLQPSAAAARLARTRQKLQPALASKAHAGILLPTAGRRRLLQAPIWFSPRVASKFATTSFAYRDNKGENHGIFTTNVQPQRVVEGVTGDYNPGGLLTWMDLDLMMFLSAVFLSRKVDYIDTDQRSIFAAIGYAALDDPPYQELRSAIARLVGTQIWTVDEGEEGRIEGPVLLPRLLETNEELKAAWRKEGRYNKLVVAVGHGWLSEVAGENQVVDLNAYLYLVRAIRAADAIKRTSGPSMATIRPPDISRSILLFLDSMRLIEGKRHQAVISTRWLQDRFGDRQQSIPAAYQNVDLKRRAEDLGRGRDEPSMHPKTEAQRLFAGMPTPLFKYIDPLHPRSRVRIALDALVEMKILQPYELKGDRLTITWTDPRSLPRLQVDARDVAWSDMERLPGGGDQLALVHVDKLTGGLRPVEGGVAITADSAVVPLPAPGMAVGSSAEEGVLAGLGKQRYLAEWRFLQRLVPIHRSTLEAAQRRGWMEHPHLRHLLIVTLWKRSNGQVRDPAAFAAKQLAELTPPSYERPALSASGLPLEEIMRWWGGDQGPKKEYSEMWAQVELEMRKDVIEEGGGATRRSCETSAGSAPVAAGEAMEETPAENPAIDENGGGIDEEALLARELRTYSAVARQLGLQVETVPQRVKEAQRILSDEVLYLKWQRAVQSARDKTK